MLLKNSTDKSNYSLPGKRFVSFLFLFAFLINLLAENQEEAIIYENRFLKSYSNTSKNYDGMFSLEQAFSYQNIIADSLNLKFEHESRMGRNSKYDRLQKDMLNKWLFFRNSPKHDENIHFEHAYTYDKASPEQNSYTFRSFERKSGISLAYRPSTIIILQPSVFYIDRTEERTEEVKEYGYQYGGSLQITPLTSRYSEFFPDESIAKVITVSYSGKEMNKNWNRNWVAESKYFCEGNHWGFKSAFNFERNKKEAYLLSSVRDTEKKTKSSMNLAFASVIFHDIDIIITSLTDYNQRSLLSSSDKDNFNWSQNLSFYTKIPLNKRFELTFSGNHNFTDKEIKGNISKQENTFKQFQAGIAYYFSKNQRDSLQFQRTIYLDQTDDLTANATFDNDKLNDVYKLSFYTYLNDRLRLTNHSIYGIRKDIYLRKTMSATNSTVTTYNLQPALELVLGEKISIKQNYHLKAEYTDYHYNNIDNDPETDQKDRFFRVFSAEYKWIYDNTPYIRTEGCEQWKHLPSDSRCANPFSVELAYSIHTNNTSEQDGDNYNTTSKNRYHTIHLDVAKSIENILLRARPKLLWAVNKEFSLLSSISYQLSSENYVDFMVIPSWKNPEKIKVHWTDNHIFPQNITGIKDITWKIEFELRYAF